MNSLALLLIGFSLFSVPTLALTHFRKANYADQAEARFFGLLLIAALAGLQVAHWGWLYLDRPWVSTAFYRVLLFLVAPTFLGFSRPLLRGSANSGRPLTYLAHSLPITLAPWLSPDVALPLAFFIGAAYLVALGRDLFRLRSQREYFTGEFLSLGTIFVIAIGVAALGVLQAQLPDKLFFILYAVAIGLAFLLVQIALGLRPHLREDVTESAKAAYANSTLTRVDCTGALAQLERLMSEERAYQNADLGLASLADRLGLTTHQLSELFNTQLGKSFSRYVREQRVAAAKTMLREEPAASVLSVGLSVGFSTQSNFYEAFREIEGMTPGQYRKLNPKQADEQ